MKYSAFVLMLVDHLNSYVLGGDQEWMYQAGRLVFPCFALVLGAGCQDSSVERLRSLVARLLFFAVLAEVVAMPLVLAGVREPAFNVVFTMAAGVCLVVADRADGWRVRLVALVLAVWLSWPAEYGLIGAGLVWAVATRRGAFELVLVAVLCLWQGTPTPALAYAFLEVAGRCFGWEQWRGPRLAFGALYVAQFVGFSLAQQ